MNSKIESEINYRLTEYQRCRIAFSGKMGAGKSTLAKKIMEKYPQFKTYSFASGVKKVATEIFDMKEKNRELLIQIGNKMRDIDPDVWAKNAIREMENYDYCLVDDLRYPNEAKFLQEAGFLLVKLDIDPETQKKRLQNAYPNTWEKHLEFQNHFTEKGLSNDTFDLILQGK